MALLWWPKLSNSAERVRHHGQRLVQVGFQKLLVGHVVRHLAHAVHVVGKADQPGWNVGDDLEGAAHHGGARHLAEGADMRQARGPIARLEQHVSLFGRRLLVAFHQPARLFEGPGLGGHRGVAYALACDVAAADGTLGETELRLLEEFRYELDIDRLAAAAIERAARARHVRG
jgi:hypothetical protein